VRLAIVVAAHADLTDAFVREQFLLGASPDGHRVSREVRESPNRSGARLVVDCEQITEIEPKRKVAEGRNRLGDGG
jgi:hypothetical protein